MAYSYDTRYNQSRSQYSHFPGSRDRDGYANPNSSGYFHTYEPRHSSYTAAPPIPPRSPAYPQRPEVRRKQRWPPSPSVEDETASLEREVRSDSSLKDALTSGEVPSRGTVDQPSIMEDVEQPKIVENDDRRFVLVSDQGTTVKGPPISAADASSTIRDRRRKSFAERGNIPHLKTDIDDPPVYTKREPSPYAYSKPSKDPVVSDYFLSPETITPSTSTVPTSIPKRDTRDSPKDQSAKPERRSHNRYDSFTSSPRTTKNDVFDDSETDGDDAASLRVERKPARYSFVKSDLQRDDLRTSLHDTRIEPPSAPRSSDPRLATDSSFSGSSHSSKGSTPPAQSPRSSTSSLHNTSLPQQVPVKKPPSSTEAPYSRSPRRHHDRRPTSPLRPSSPRPGEKPPPISPPRSPKISSSRGIDSPPGSRPGSRADNRPPSPSPLSYTTSLPPPSPPRAPVSASDWHSTYPPTTNDQYRNARYNRYDTMPVPIPRVDIQSPSPARPPKPDNPLPYPVDDRPLGAFMPAEENFQTMPSPTIPQSPGLGQPYPESPRMPSSPITSTPRERPAPARPPLKSYQTENAPRSPRERSSSMRSQSNYDGRRKERKAGGPTGQLPLCPRQEPTDKYNDWYMLEKCPNFDVCPSCFDAVFAGTKYDDYFHQSRRYETPVFRTCDFSSAWVRIAWLLSIQQQRNGLDLLYRLATITEKNKPCPDSQSESREWYGIEKRDGLHVSNFTVCKCDVKQLEVLFPSLRGCFTPIPSSKSKSELCSLRTSSTRFATYLDLLVEIDAVAQSSRSRTPDLRPFIALAQENAWRMECPKDRAGVGKPWHFIPSLPAFTVCEECYDAVVWPDIKANSKLASEFQRTLQLVPGETSFAASGEEPGSSCCLYSTRMRKVWRRAVEDEDFGYLKRKAEQRKKMEGIISQEREAALKVLEGRGEWRAWEGGSGRVDGAERERANKQLSKLDKEWKEWE